ncbi:MULTISPECIES: hypothetical protein [Cyanophyceae]|uniref:hypothetical protein n=1 Tax=Cyanophyceae TaxID=3028117 RepID=UPI00016DCBE9|nr:MULTISPECIES: hypothetical protein [Cyanophyceae]ACB00038.1 conserved hypothetical protein [Picosynechococcus sp. PCC 7002]AMA09677.1 hypothetical protein AWQ23_10270 [Picosynechococcus sp. PCC 73109]ANV87841.1 hypothetical protein AWQ22_10400 [Picosynechococcus sp. PCC 7117]ANV91034.1 hypothetical protein AWQ24_10505 [Picosynechococcus sp. PCC 8807]QCS50544.1 hypothetical protein FEK30_14535 [Picosynechococcus sp. PCC 11901]
MFGQFQQSNIRLEINASSQTIRESLTQPQQLKQWLWLQRWPELPAQLTTGTTFTTQIGVVPIHHTVETLHDHGIRFLLRQGIDGFHGWSWDDGWLQSHLEGVSLLPLNLGQTVTLLSLRRFIETKAAKS